MSDHTSQLQRAKAIEVLRARAVRRDPVCRSLQADLDAARAEIAALKAENAQYHAALHEATDKPTKKPAAK
jgi:predicted  nucleic acid-binding Zn-ribbon protein